MLPRFNRPVHGGEELVVRSSEPSPKMAVVGSNWALSHCSTKKHMKRKSNTETGFDVSGPSNGLLVETSTGMTTHEFRSTHVLEEMPHIISSAAVIVDEEAVWLESDEQRLRRTWRLRQKADLAG